MPVAQAEARELFYSYSHKDAELRDELERHLSILKRSGVVQSWHDRDIDAGKEWAGQIHNHLNRAHVILLLISADFLASDYCYDVEMKRALERHAAGEAIVIPVILRPVEWSGAPFAKLQCLPEHALPVTSWANRDEAFQNVAEGIRRAILKVGRTAETAVQERVLDAALPSRVPVGESTELLAMVRRTSSDGLKAFLHVDESYEVSEQDVRSKPFCMEFGRDVGGEPRPQILTVRIESGDFDLANASKQISVPPEEDSDTCFFLITARRAGRLQLVVEVLHEGLTVASHLLRTNGGPAAQPGTPVPYVLASLPLTTYAQLATKPAPHAPVGEFTRVLEPPRDDAPVRPQARAVTASAPAAAPRPMASRVLLMVMLALVALGVIVYYWLR